MPNAMQEALALAIARKQERESTQQAPIQADGPATSPPSPRAASQLNQEGITAPPAQTDTSDPPESQATDPQQPASRATITTTPPPTIPPPCVTVEIALDARLALWRHQAPERKFVIPKTDGSKLQSNSGTVNRDAELSIGLDFGTSCTKVVIWDAARSRGWAVRFRLGDGPASYLAPGRLFVENGQFHLEHGSMAFRDLKLSFLAATDDPVARARLAAFFALILRQARGWFLGEHGGLYRNTNIFWTLACGLPARSWGDGAAATGLTSCLEAAWTLSCSSSPITETAASHALRGDVQSQKAAPNVDIRVIPELFAQIYGFVESTGYDPLARNFFLLCDIGAGTVDTALFRVQDRHHGRVRFDLFTSQVEQLGVSNLHRHRTDWWHRQLQPLAGTQHLVSALDGVALPTDHELQHPESFHDYFSGVEATIPNTALDPDVNFFRRVSTQVRSTFYQAWRQGYLGHNDLRDTPLFLCGGGSRMHYFQAIPAAIPSPGATWLTVAPRNFDLPEDLDAPGVSAQDYDRLSVAYGLARLSLGPLDGPDAMQVRAPNPMFEVPPPRAVGPDFTDRDVWE